MGAKRIIQNICLFLVSFFLLIGCNQSFEPLQDNNKYYFSIYGYLDAAADTQWVRVGPARQDINELPDPKGIKVTLENVQSSKTVVMNDSLFTSKNFLNYWTTMDIDNEQTYRMTAERNGNSSRVTITTPKEIPAPYVVNDAGPQGSGYNVYIDADVEHITDVQSVWFVTLNPETEPQRRIYTFSIRKNLKYTTAFGKAYFTFANHSWQSDHIEQNIGSSDYSVNRIQFFIAAGGPEWNENISSIEDLEYFLNTSTSNVENGLGYVVGIDSKWITQRTCVAADGSKYIPCSPDDGPFWYSE